MQKLGAIFRQQLNVSVIQNAQVYLKSEEKKRDTFKNWPLIKDPHFLSDPHETWLK